MKECNQQDALGELFRQKLSNHRTPVEQHWDQIERSLNRLRHKTMMRWMGGGMAAAAMIAGLLLFPRPSTDETHQVIEMAQQVNVIEMDDKSLQNDLLAVVQNPVWDRPAGAPKPPVQKEAEQSENQETAPIQQEEVLVAATDMPPAAQERREPPAVNLWTEEDFPTGKTTLKKDKKWTLAAAFGAGGGSSTSIAPNALKTRYNFVYAPKAESNLASSVMYLSSGAHFTNTRHLPPLSFGLMIWKNTGTWGGIQSGVVYTYLASQFQGLGYEIHQKLHYIGIPVHLSVNLWNVHPRWSIYSTAGFMVEKGVQGTYRQIHTSFITDFMQTTVVKSNFSIDGLQWSLHGALGINYRLGKSFGIYAEPRFGYHFDCNQPTSMRTEWPVSIGFGMGINYVLR
ncbi:MAG: hypothetical protein FWE99_02520 [Bacteroidales bacterium]|nr:hypothetical protein [Bacteroidales bacterium]